MSPRANSSGAFTPIAKKPSKSGACSALPAETLAMAHPRFDDLPVEVAGQRGLREAAREAERQRHSRLHGEGGARAENLGEALSHAGAGEAAQRALRSGEHARPAQQLAQAPDRQQPLPHHQMGEPGFRPSTTGCSMPARSRTRTSSSLPPPMPSCATPAISFCMPSSTRTKRASPSGCSITGTTTNTTWRSMTSAAMAK